MQLWERLEAASRRECDVHTGARIPSSSRFYCAETFALRFLDVLAARKDPAGLSGEVLIDGAPQPPNFKCLSGYVVQVSETGGSGTGSQSHRRQEAAL